MTGITYPDGLWRPWRDGYEVKDIDLSFETGEPNSRGVIVRSIEHGPQICWGKYWIEYTTVTIPPRLTDHIEALTIGVAQNAYRRGRHPGHRRRTVDYYRTTRSREAAIEQCIRELANWRAPA